MLKVPLTFAVSVDEPPMTLGFGGRPAMPISALATFSRARAATRSGDRARARDHLVVRDRPGLLGARAAGERRDEREGRELGAMNHARERTPPS